LPILNAGMQQLKAHGVDNVMINGGGDVLVNGTLNEHPWRVGLRDPREPSKVIGEVAMTQGFIAASGDYERYFMYQGRRLHHVLDPKTGYPSLGTRGVALVSDKLDDINGLGTAIMVGGVAMAQSAIDKTLGLHVLVASSDNSLWLSPGMRQRLT
jgi:FAD:protein FMN transferase